MRQLDHITSIARRYPGCWDTYARCFAVRGGELPDWPAWCYCPMAAAYAVVSGGGDQRIPPGDERAMDISRLAALAAWRATKGVYRFDPEIRAALLATPIDRLPAELLYALPEWCVYIETPGHMYGALPIHGYYAHLDSEPDTGEVELRLLLDADAGLVPSIVHLRRGSLTESAREFADQAMDQVVAHGLDDSPIVDYVLDMRLAAGELASMQAPLVSLLLYLCSEAPDISGPRGEPQRSPPAPIRRTKRGVRLVEAKRPVLWETAYRLGRSIRKAREVSPPTGATVRPHVRRAHWHTYWIGSRRAPEGQRAVLRWLHPILIHGEQSPPTTIHHIRRPHQ